MRELRFVTRDELTDHVVVEAPGFGDSAGERFLLTVDDNLRAALQPLPAETPRRPSPTPAVTPETVGPAASEAAISPREIQMRVRAGELPDEIAESFNASLEWVMRFAGPVLEERSRVGDEARRARARRSTSDASTVIFGETVDERFTAHGIDPTLVTWDTYRREDGQWIVSARWIGGDSERLAEWSFNLAARSVSPIDETATDLLSDRPIRPVHADGPVTLTVAPPLAPGVVAFPAMPNAHTGPLPTREQLFDQQQFEDAARHPSARPATVLSFEAPPLPLGTVEQFPEPTFDDEPLDEAYDSYQDVAIDDELDYDMSQAEESTAQLPQVTNLGIAHREPVAEGPTEPAPEAVAETEDERAARAHIPSWDDILLGVRRKGD